MSGRVVLVCGGRGYSDVVMVFETLDALHSASPIERIVEGGARGADRAARHWATDRGISRVTHEARWGDDGKAAGPLRNQRMLDVERPQLVVAFPGGPGTADMVRRARIAGVDVLEVPP